MRIRVRVIRGRAIVTEAASAFFLAIVPPSLVHSLMSFFLSSASTPVTCVCNVWVIGLGYNAWV